MIGQLKGTVETSEKDTLIVDVGGVGYIVHVTTDTLATITLGKPIILKTHLSVREDALDLYGFTTLDEVAFFKLLIGISGIGPRSALAIMNLGEVGSLKAAIQSSDVGYLTRVSGIGRKNAEKIVLELRDKLGSTSDFSSPLLKEDADVIEALESLGYTRIDARDAVKQIPKSVVGTNAKLKEALKMLGKA